MEFAIVFYSPANMNKGMDWDRIAEGSLFLWHPAGGETPYGVVICAVVGTSGVIWQYPPPGMIEYQRQEFDSLMADMPRIFKDMNRPKVSVFEEFMKPPTTDFRALGEIYVNTNYTTAEEAWTEAASVDDHIIGMLADMNSEQRAEAASEFSAGFTAKFAQRAANHAKFLAEFPPFDYGNEPPQ